MFGGPGITIDDRPNAHAQELQVQFEARAVSEEDFHGICRLLRQVWYITGAMSPTINMFTYVAASIIMISQPHHVGMDGYVGVVVYTNQP